MTDTGRLQRERDHYDHVIPSAVEVLEEFKRGPDPNVALMLAAAQPGPGRRIIDFACGGGVTSLWLATSGAEVIGIDLSPKSIAVAREAAQRAGLDVTFEVADLETYALGEGFDAMVGRFALHHLDVDAIAPAMTRCIKAGASAAFVETFATNPVLRLARNHLVGRFGVRRVGTLDEHPLVAADIDALRAAFGQVRIETPFFRFLRILDRQILRFRYRGVSRVLGAIDDVLGRIPALRNWSYQQVVICTRTQ